MLTPDMIDAESQDPAITPEQKMNLMLLVKGAYPSYAAVWSSTLSDSLDDEIDTPTVKTKALKAVLTQLNALPAEDVESQGDVNSPTFYSSNQNWRTLALDVLDLYDIHVAGVPQSHGVVQRTVDDGLLLEDDIYLALDQRRTGRRY